MHIAINHQPAPEVTKAEREKNMDIFEKIFGKNSNKNRVIYINEADGRLKKGQYINSREEAEADNLHMKKAWEGNSWCVIIIED